MKAFLRHACSQHSCIMHAAYTTCPSCSNYLYSQCSSRLRLLEHCMVQAGCWLAASRCTPALALAVLVRGKGCGCRLHGHVPLLNCVCKATDVAKPWP